MAQVRKSSVEIERNDSGVGSETSKCSRSRWQHLPASQQHSCEDCDQPVETQVTDRSVHGRGGRGYNQVTGSWQVDRHLPAVSKEQD